MKYMYGAAVMAACVAAAQAEENPLIATTMEFLARASSTSEVLTLNLTNLLILLALKGLLLAFGFISFGSSSNYRSSDYNSPSIKQSDLTGGMCFMMYTAGDLEKLSCVQRSACEDPKTATDYLTAAKMWYKMHKMMKVVPFTDTYFNIMNAVQDATDHSLNGGECSHFKW